PEEVDELQVFIRQGEISVQSHYATARSPTCNILIDSELQIELRGESLKRDVVLVEEKSLYPEAGVVLPEEAIPVILHEYDEILAIQLGVADLFFVIGSELIGDLERADCL